jgi:hypothetical protein
MTNEEIKSFLKKINSLKLSKSNKKRMLRLLQIRYNKKNKVMSYKELKEFLKNNNYKIKTMILGPDWNPVVFIDLEEKIIC